MKIVQYDACTIRIEEADGDQRSALWEVRLSTMLRLLPRPARHLGD